MMSADDTDRDFILVTGASGYIGGRLVPRLLEMGCRVRCLVRDPARLQELNAILHPKIMERIEALAARHRAAAPRAVILVEAALIYEAGVADRFGKVIVAWCRPEQQRERLRARQAVPPEQIEPRLAAQMPLEEKRRRAGYVIDCSGSLENTQAQVAAVYGKLKQLAAGIQPKLESRR